MTGKKKANFLLPEPILDLFDELSDDLNGKEKWIAISAAVLMLAATPKHDRRNYYGEISKAMYSGDFKGLIGKSIRGELRGSSPKSDSRPIDKSPITTIDTIRDKGGRMRKQPPAGVRN